MIQHKAHLIKSSREQELPTGQNIGAETREVRWLSREKWGKGERERTERVPSAMGTVHNSVRLGKELKWEGAIKPSQSINREEEGLGIGD